MSNSAIENVAKTLTLVSKSAEAIRRSDGVITKLSEVLIFEAAKPRWPQTCR